jgi:hypothetical protein
LARDGIEAVFLGIQIFNDDVFLSSPPRMFPSWKYTKPTKKEKITERSSKTKNKQTIKKKR